LIKWIDDLVFREVRKQIVTLIRNIIIGIVNNFLTLWKRRELYESKMD